MTITVYHTLENRGNKRLITTPLKCTRTDAWLGEGYYFWDTDINLAREWGKKALRGSYYIFKTEIKHDESMFDLYGNRANQIDFCTIANILKEKALKNKDPEPVVNDVLDYLKNIIYRDKGFPYTSIRCSDEPKYNKTLSLKFNSRKERKEQLIISNSRVQICTYELSPINLHTFTLVEEAQLS